MRPDGQTDTKQTDVAKLVVSFHNSANAPKNDKTLLTQCALNQHVTIFRFSTGISFVHHIAKMTFTSHTVIYCTIIFYVAVLVHFVTITNQNYWSVLEANLFGTLSERVEAVKVSSCDR